MNITHELEQLFGGNWVGISFFHKQPEQGDDFTLNGGFRFCEAISKARVHPVLQKPGESPCPGNRYVFGHLKAAEETLSKKLIHEKGLSDSFSETLIKETPRFDSPLWGIGFNMKCEPDVLFAPLQPEHAMVLLQKYEKVMARTPRVPISTFFSLCANVAIYSYQSNDMALSFGCPDARTFGRFSRDRLFVGLSREMALNLI